LRKFGLDPAKDVTIVQIGGIPELLAAMKAGAISGGSMSPPVLTAAKKAGFKEFADFESLDYRYPAVAIADNQKFYPAAARHDRLNFLRGEIEGIHAIKTQKSFAVNVLKKYMRISDPEILEEGYQLCAAIYPARPLPKLEEPRRC